MRCASGASTSSPENGLAALIFLIAKKHRRIALLNLDATFGDSWTEMQKRAMVRENFRHYCRALLETLRLSRITPQNYGKFMDIEGLEILQAEVDAGKGVLFCTAHYGNWEYMNLALGYLGLPMSVMARPMDNPLVHTFVEDLRSRGGNRIIYKTRALRKIISNLREGRVVGIVNDQNVHDRNKRMALFFNRPATNAPTPAALALKCGVPIVCGYSVPQGNGRYLLKFGPVIRPDFETKDKEAEIDRILLELNLQLERQIRACPHAWFWVHKRFKHNAAGETKFYKQARDC